jgi:hypothetical protein
MLRLKYPLAIGILRPECPSGRHDVEMVFEVGVNR